MAGNPALRRGIHCIETVWFDATSSMSMRPALDYLHARFNTPYIHRNAITRDEFLAHLDIWSRLPTEGDVRHPILLLSYHGKTEGIALREVEEDEKEYDEQGDLVYPSDCIVSLPEIADAVGNCDNKVLHFASCSTVDVGNDVVEEFLDETNASSVSGYRDDVYWGDSLAFDMLFLGKVQEAPFVKLKPKIMKQVSDDLKESPYSELREELGFSLRVPANL